MSIMRLSASAHTMILLWQQRQLYSKLCISSALCTQHHDADLASRATHDLAFYEGTSATSGSQEATTGPTGGGAETHSSSGVKTGRQYS